MCTFWKKAAEVISFYLEKDKKYFEIEFKEPKQIENITQFTASKNTKKKFEFHSIPEH